MNLEFKFVASNYKKGCVALRNLDILFINPNVSEEEIYGKRFKKLGAMQPPLGMCYIASYLREKKITSRILDANYYSYSNHQICNTINSLSPSIVGIYATTMCFNKVRKLAEDIKSTCKDIPIVLGGPHLQACQEDFTSSCFDYGVVGEGEITVAELILAFNNDPHDLGNVKGLLWKKNGKAIFNGFRPYHEPLDDFPIPARDMLPPIDKYHLKAMITKLEPATHLLSSRGCPYGCIFCNNIFGRKVRYHSAEYVINEVSDLVYNYGMKEITFNDDTFLINAERVYEICELIKKNKLKFTWSCLMNVKNVKKELLKAIRDAGCWLIQPGIESGNQRILNSIGKPVNLEEAKMVCAWAKEIGLKVKPSFIIGLPGETEESIEETIKYAISLKTHYPAFALMTPYPGTKLWDEMDNYGSMISTEYDKLNPARYVSFVPYGLSAELLKRKQIEAYRRCYLRVDMVIRHLLSIRNYYDLRKMVWAAEALLSK